MTAIVPSSVAQLLRRVFAIQVLVCPRCGGPRRILEAVTETEPHAVRRLLNPAGGGGPGPPASASQACRPPGHWPAASMAC